MGLRMATLHGTGPEKKRTNSGANFTSEDG